MLAAQVTYAMSNMVSDYSPRSEFLPCRQCQYNSYFFSLRVSHLLRLVALFSVSPHSSPEKLTV